MIRGLTSPSGARKIDRKARVPLLDLNLEYARPGSACCSSSISASDASSSDAASYRTWFTGAGTSDFSTLLEFGYSATTPLNPVFFSASCNSLALALNWELSSAK